MIDIGELKKQYFAFDKSVPYKLKCGVEIKINPVLVSNYAEFSSSYGILTIDKNSASDVDIIQMSYLKYLALCFSSIQGAAQQLANICFLCMDFQIPLISFDKNGKTFLYNIDENKNPIFIITEKEFDDIKRIILHQNIPSYDDQYLDPEVAAVVDEVNSLKQKNIEIPDIERQMSIITAHTGILKKEQLTMTLREFAMLFDEVAGEVEYSAVKGISCLGDKSDEVQWIYKKKKNKFDGYFTTVEKYNKSMGGNGNVAQINSEVNSSYLDKFIGG